jgi:hypothetical protein
LSAKEKKSVSVLRKQGAGYSELSGPGASTHDVTARTIKSTAAPSDWQQIAPMFGLLRNMSNPGAENCTIHLSPRFPVCPPPIMEILPVQMMSLALAAMVGRQQGKFRFAAKITSTE